MDGFIRKFVLCPECDNPETTLTVSQKKATINQACKACGYHGPLEFNHKLNTFIIKNPPSMFIFLLFIFGFLIFVIYDYKIKLNFSEDNYKADYEIAFILSVSSLCVLYMALYVLFVLLQI